MRRSTRDLLFSSAAAEQQLLADEALVSPGAGFRFKPEATARTSLLTAFPGASGSMLPDNYQPVELAWNVPGPTALIDVYTPNKNTTGTLVVDGAHVIASSDTPGDNDWFAVTLTAGHTYEFGQYA